MLNLIVGLLHNNHVNRKKGRWLNRYRNKKVKKIKDDKEKLVHPQLPEKVMKTTAENPKNVKIRENQKDCAASFNYVQKKKS